MPDPARGDGRGAGPLEPVPRKSLADDIAERLRSRIFDGTYPPGEKLPPERELARQLNVNRGSIREALKKLQHLGLIRIRQGDGTRVLNFFQTANLDLIKYLLSEGRFDRGKILKDLLEVRTHTCVIIVRLAARRAPRQGLLDLREALEKRRGDHSTTDPEVAVQMDFEFYEDLARLAGNNVLTVMLNTVKPPFRVLKPVFSRLVPEIGGMLATEDAILDALLDGQEDAAAALAQLYLERGASFLMDGSETREA